MKRRHFLALLAALPGIGRLVPTEGGTSPPVAEMPAATEAWTNADQTVVTWTATYASTYPPGTVLYFDMSTREMKTF